jgi:hypothetical protein
MIAQEAKAIQSQKEKQPASTRRGSGLCSTLLIFMDFRWPEESATAWFAGAHLQAGKRPMSMNWVGLNGFLSHWIDRQETPSGQVKEHLRANQGTRAVEDGLEAWSNERTWT